MACPLCVAAFITANLPIIAAATATAATAAAVAFGVTHGQIEDNGPIVQVLNDDPEYESCESCDDDMCDVQDTHIKTRK